MPRLLLLVDVVLCCCLLAKTWIGADGLELTTLEVPLIVDPRSAKVPLRCEYDLEGAALYSITWYRNDFEFFRYMPGGNPPGRAFSVPGVEVDVDRSDAEQVTLLGQAEGVNLAGTYACEVSAESPNFLTKYQSANMSVAVVPTRDPVIDGVRASYTVDEIMEAECTSAPSYPAANLTFVINDKQVPVALTRDLTPAVRLPVDGGIQLSTTRLGLKLKLDRTHFPGGSLSLMCRSTLPGISAVRARTMEVTSTLAANNERLEQERPEPRSSAESTRVLYIFLTPFTAAIVSLNFIRQIRVC